MAKMKDMTEPRRRLTVEVDSSPVYDLLLSLWAMASNDSPSEYELGEEWFHQLEERIPTKLREGLKALEDARGNLWVAVLNVLPQVSQPRDLDALISWLEDSDGTAIRECLIGMKCHSQDEASIQRAAEGDAEATEEILSALADEPEWQRDLREMLNIEELGSRVAALLRQYGKEVYAEISFAGPIARDAEAKGALLPTTSADRMIEIATNGVHHDLPASVSKLILAPTVVLRPWSLLAGHGDTFVLCHPVADEFLQDDAEAPPQLLVKTHRALGDERRLKILHRLAAEPTSLQDLAEHFDVAKSTLHHHIGILRAAGLVTVSVHSDTGQTVYGLRRAALEEASRLMEIYLHATTPQENP